MSNVILYYVLFKYVIGYIFITAIKWNKRKMQAFLNEKTVTVVCKLITNRICNLHSL